MIQKRALLIILFFGLQRLFAASLDVYTDSSESYVGQPLTLTMRISASQAVNRPELPEMEGFQVSPQGQSQYSQGILFGGSGSRAVTMEYTWRLMPLKTGTLTIPGFDLKMPDGESLQSREIEILIREPGPIEGYHLFLTAQGETVFPGIPVRVTLKWLFSSEVRRPEFTIPFLDQKGVKVEDLPPPSSGTSDIYQFTVSGRKVYGVQSAEIFEGEQYASLSMGWDLYPEEPGTLNLDAVHLAFQRGGVNRQGRRVYEPAVIPSNSLSLKVEDLPEEMASFPGGILVAEDELTVTAELDQTRVYPGDPLTLTLRLSGLTSPDLTDFKGAGSLKELQGSVRADGATLLSDTEGKDLVVKQSIRIETSSLDAFPAIEFPYFSLKKGKVMSVRSNAVPLTMLDLDGSAGQSASTGKTPGLLNWNRTEVNPGRGGISLKGNRTLQDRGGLYSSRLLLAALLAVLTLLILALPTMVTLLRSIRFGKDRADIRIRLKQALKDYKRHPDPVRGQALYDLLILWRNERGGTEDSLDNLIRDLEEMLWAGDEESEGISGGDIDQRISSALKVGRLKNPEGRQKKPGGSRDIPATPAEGAEN